MKVEKNKVVTISYQISEENGEILESSKEYGDLDYVYGSELLVPGMDAALLSKKIGDKIDTIIKAKDAFGEYDESFIFSVPREEIPISNENLEEGLEFQAEIGGVVRFCQIEEIKDDNVVINANHPYAGMDIHFEAEILNIRDATDEEIEHGHIHGEGGCCGDSCCGDH